MWAGRGGQGGDVGGMQGNLRELGVGGCGRIEQRVAAAVIESGGCVRNRGEGEQVGLKLQLALDMMHIRVLVHLRHFSN
jgi:hypothetical protein